MVRLYGGRTGRDSPGLEKLLIWKLLIVCSRRMKTCRGRGELEELGPCTFLVQHN
jgi:hypothetical protein